VRGREWHDSRKERERDATDLEGALGLECLSDPDPDLYQRSGRHWHHVCFDCMRRFQLPEGKTLTTFEGSEALFG